ncbi:MAG: glycosyltransferase 87 family protein, partial [Candidatus Dormibacteria bacterium]
MATWRRPRLRRRLFLVTAAAAALVGLDLARWATIGSDEMARSDFPALAAGGYLVTRGARAQVYDPASQAQVYRAVIQGTHSGFLPFNHAPLSALLYAPTSRLPLVWAYHAFGALQALFLVAGCLLALRAAPWPPGSPRLLKVGVLIAALAGAGTLPLLLQGQDDGVIALAVGAAYFAVRRHRSVLGGAILAFVAGGTKPHLLLGVVVLIGVRRDLRLLGGAAVGALLAVVVSLGAVGPAGLAGFARVALSSSTAWPSHWFLGLPAIPASLLGENTAAHTTGLGLSIVALGAAAWFAGRWREAPHALEAGLGGALCLSLAAAPHLLGHDLVILTPLLIALGARAAGVSPARL